MSPSPEKVPGADKVTRRKVIGLAGAFAAASAVPALGQTESKSLDPALAEWAPVWLRRGTLRGPKDPLITDLQESIDAVSARYRADALLGKLDIDTSSEYAKRLYKLSLEQGKLYKEYEINNHPYSEPEAITTLLTDLFEDAIREVEVRAGLSQVERSALKTRLFAKYLEDVNSLNIFNLDERMTSARVQGYYCGYFRICPGDT